MSRLKFVKWHFFALLLLLWVGLKASAIGQESLADLKNYVPITKQLHTCGKIDESDLGTIKAAGIETIISLNTESPSQLKLLKQTATSLGMTLILIPVSWKAPTIGSLKQFFEAMETYQSVELLVHCRLNWRASAFVYLYRTLQQGVPEAEAKVHLLEVWNPWKYKTWRSFIVQAQAQFSSKNQ